MNIMRCCAILSCAVAASALARASEVNLVYYDISGRTANDLRREMDAKGPVGDDGKRFDAYTQWHVAWKYRYVITPGSCRLSEVTATNDGTMTLPRWIDIDAVPTGLASQWQRYMAALRLHENGHYEHGVEAAAEIEALGASFPPADDCASLGRDFNERADAIVRRYGALDATYDHDTDHGKTQGAVFP